MSRRICRAAGGITLAMILAGASASAQAQRLVTGGPVSLTFDTAFRGDTFFEPVRASTAQRLFFLGFGWHKITVQLDQNYPSGLSLRARMKEPRALSGTGVSTGWQQLSSNERDLMRDLRGKFLYARIPTEYEARASQRVRPGEYPRKVIFTVTRQ